jgi:glycosyltransferase involved in cell wall biosynthesis
VPGADVCAPTATAPRRGTTNHPGRVPGRVSVIVCAHDAERHLAAQLESLAEQDYERDHELIVVDHASTDRTATIAKRFARCRVVHLARPLGIHRARNTGARHATGDLLVYCDADDVCAPDWLGELVRAAGDADLVGGRLDDVALNAPRVRAWRDPSPQHSLPLALGRVPYASSANLAIWSDVFWSLDGFDETWGRAGTEAELAWRAHLAGFRLAFAQDAVVHYRHRSTLVGTARQAFRYGADDARLQERFASCGAPSGLHPNAATGLRWLTRALPAALVRPTVRGRWVHVAGHGVGWCAIRLRTATRP